MKIRFSFMLVVSCFIFLVACNQQEDFSSTYGTWYSDGTIMPTVFTITENSFKFSDGTEVGITFEKVENQINIINAAHKNTIISILVVDKNSLTANYQGDQKTFSRITEQQAKELLKKPSLQNTTGQNATEFPDPF